MQAKLTLNDLAHSSALTTTDLVGFGEDHPLVSIRCQQKLLQVPIPRRQAMANVHQ
jgi:hypothetical protein